jgi:hypothetical protein
MADFAYTTVPGKIKELFEKVRTTGVPAKATNTWLEQLGLKSTNDRSLLSILKFVQFTDSNGVPTDRWKAYRGANPKHVLGEAIRAGYAALFQIYPDAWQRKDTDFENFFRSQTTAGEQVVDKTVSTFKALLTLADFNGTSLPEDTPQPPDAGRAPNAPTRHHGKGPHLHLDIQIHIAADASAEQIDQIFASMAKHLYNTQDNG